MASAERIMGMSREDLQRLTEADINSLDRTALVALLNRGDDISPTQTIHSLRAVARFDEAALLEAKSRGEQERKAREEAEARGELERKGREEERKALEEERKAREEAEARGELERKAREEERKAREEERKAREEAEARGELERKAREVAEARGEEERKAREEERKAREEAEARADRVERKQKGWVWINKDCRFRSRRSTYSTGCTSVPINYKPREVQRWDPLADAVDERFKMELTTLDFPMALRLESGGDVMVDHGEASVKAMMRQNLSVVAELIRNCTMKGLDILDEFSCFDPASASNGGWRKPDATLSEGGRPILILEYKRKEVLDISGFDQSYLDGVPRFSGVLKCPLTQLVSYMRLHECSYGVLSSYYKTFFVKFGDSGVVHVSNAFCPKIMDSSDYERAWMNNSAIGETIHPTLLQALATVTLLALEDPDSQTLAKEWFVMNKCWTSRIMEAKGRQEKSKRKREENDFVQEPNASSDANHENDDAMETLFEIDNVQSRAIPVLYWNGVGFRHVKVRNKDCFVKILLPSAKDTYGEARRDLEREAVIYEQLDHDLGGEMIPRMVFYGETDRGLTLVTEDVGESLESSEGMRRVRKLGPQEALKRAEEVLGALHSRGILHGDIAKRNFCIDEQLNIKIIDFGKAMLCSKQVPKILPAELDKMAAVEMKMLVREFTDIVG